MGATLGLILCMTEPIHQTGKILTHDSGFCIAKGVIELHKHGVCGQSLIKKQGRYWPCSLPGDLIDEYFGDKGIETRMMYMQVIEGIDFFIHCQEDDGYVSKIMSTHGPVNEVQGNATSWMVRGQHITCYYAKPHLGYNKVKHWVNDNHNRRYDPINIAETWRTK